MTTNQAMTMISHKIRDDHSSEWRTEKKKGGKFSLLIRTPHYTFSNAFTPVPSRENVSEISFLSTLRAEWMRTNVAKKAKTTRHVVGCCCCLFDDSKMDDCLLARPLLARRLVLTLLSSDDDCWWRDGGADDDRVPPHWWCLQRRGNGSAQLERETQCC